MPRLGIYTIIHYSKCIFVNQTNIEICFAILHVSHLKEHMSSTDDPESLMIDEENSTLGLQNISDNSWITFRLEHLSLENFTKLEMKGKILF